MKASGAIQKNYTRRDLPTHPHVEYYTQSPNRRCSMTTQIQPPLRSLADWVRATDPHAPHRLRLLEQTDRILAGEQLARGDERDKLAGMLESWRYQHLNRRGGELTSEDRRLADSLDLAANELARREPRPPRCPPSAVLRAFDTPTEMAEAAAWLDPGVGLQEVVHRATELTRRHFSAPACDDTPATTRRRMLLYAPLYLSSHCINHCTYCGFRYTHEIGRRHLSVREALREADVLKRRGLRHILLVAGDFPRMTTTEYFAEILRRLTERGIHPAIEIAPRSTASYAELVAAGARGVTLYQETYDRQLYALYHPRGTKTSYDWRLEGIERAAEVGMGRLGLGILLGLAEPCQDLAALVQHARYLQTRFPDRTLAFSLPRIYEAPEGFEAPYPVDDETFIRLYCALRAAFPSAELVLSTREPASLRNRLAEICITQMSAGSCTTPGGYEDSVSRSPGGQQFPVSDHRSVAEVTAWLQAAGFEVAWETPAG